MSIQAIKWAFRQNVQPSGAKFVLVCLAEHLNADGYCYPSQRTISEETGQSERAVRNHLTALEDAGFIRRERRQGDRGHRVADRFWLVGFKSLPADSAAREDAQPATVAARDEVLPAESAVPTGNKRQSLTGRICRPYI